VDLSVRASSFEVSIICLDKLMGLQLVERMKELLRTNNPTVIAFATALLRAEGIDCFELDVHMSVLEGSIGVMPRRLMVIDKESFRARAILRDNDIELPEN